MLKETFNKPYDVSHGIMHSPPRSYEYEFESDNGIAYVSQFGQSDKDRYHERYHFEFQALYDPEGNSIDEPMGIINSGNAFQVFATILKIFKIFFKEQPKVKEVRFSAESPSRQKLYEKMIKVLSKTYGFDYDIDKSKAWKRYFRITKPKSFEQFYNEQEEQSSPKKFNQMMKWINDNLHYYETRGRSSVLAGGKIKSISRQPNAYTKMIKSGAFNQQGTDEGMLINIGPYTIYAVEAEVISGTGADFNEKTVMMQIDKDKTPWKTFLMSATKLSAIKSLLGI